MKAIRNHIIFAFERDIVRSSSGGRDRLQFEEKTDWGFDLGNAEQGFDESSKAAQWGIVKNIGHQVRDVKVGDRVLVEPLKWTTGVDFDGITYWRTDEDCILLVDDSDNL